LAAYGLWRLDEARRAGVLYLVEGESDTLTLWLQGLPALGIPGANAAKCLTADHLAGITKVYISREPDRGGQSFVEGVLSRLHSLQWQGEAFELTMPAGIKDPNELHLQCKDGSFRDAWQERVQAAPLVWPDYRNGASTVAAAGTIASG
jgi:DNA primase